MIFVILKANSTPYMGKKDVAEKLTQYIQNNAAMRSSTMMPPNGTMPNSSMTQNVFDFYPAKSESFL